jgi:aminoglycoside/choline kinase family phosphotransferase
MWRPIWRRPLTDRFFNAAGLSDREAFDAAAAVLAAQRNAKILGIFVRLAQRDGKPRYLDLLPRVERHFVRDLAHPVLAPVRAVASALTPSPLREGLSHDPDADHSHGDGRRPGHPHAPFDE